MSNNSQVIIGYNSEKELFSNRKEFLTVLYKLYKCIIEPLHILEQKTDETVQKDIVNATYSLNIDNIVTQPNMLHEKIDVIATFLNYCYVYFIHHFDRNTPFNKLPLTIDKFNLICYNLKINTDSNNIVNTFKTIIQDKFIRDLRSVNLPFYIVTDMSDHEINQHINDTIIPLCKKLLPYLTKL